MFPTDLKPFRKKRNRCQQYNRGEPRSAPRLGGYGISGFAAKSFCLCCALAWLGIAAAGNFTHASIASTWLDSHKLTATNGGDGDRFGSAVAIDGSLALVGAHKDDDLGSSSGSAYLFDTATGTGLLQLTAGDGQANDEFGFSTAIDGTQALVGAPLEDDAALIPNSGAAYLFDEVGNQLEKFTIDNAVGGEQFGYSVAIDGNVAVIGALQAMSGEGAAYVFNKVNGSWQEGPILSAGAAGSDNFGWSIALEGTTVVVGGRDANGYAGTAYVFDTTTGTQIRTLSAANDFSRAAVFDPNGGSAVSISGDLVVVGATEAEAAYVFDLAMPAMTPPEELLANDGVSGDLFGWSVGLDGKTVIVGAQGDNAQGLNSGSAYFFNAENGSQIDKVTAFDGAPFDSLGSAVAIDRGIAVVGANFDLIGGNETGSAYLFAAEADFNQDNMVNGLDLADWQTGYGTVDPGHADGDANLDGTVDGLDFLIWQRQFEAPLAAAALGQVPEPSTVGLLLLGFLLASRSRSRQS